MSSAPGAVAEVRAQRRAWLAGLVVGTAAGFTVFEAPALGVVLAVAFAVPALVGTPRLAPFGGLLTGAGGVLTVVLWMAAARCDSLNRGSAQEGCTSPDLGPWFAAGGAMVAAGLAFTVLAVARALRSRRTPS